MDLFTQIFTENEVYQWEIILDSWLFLGASAFLLFELVRYAVKKRMSWNLIGDTATNFVTLFAYLGIYGVLGGVFVVSVYYVISYNFSLTQIPITIWSVALCVVAADLTYYWEHRFTHRVGIGWATHSVHHSSPYFNISVAYRFGPLDGFFPIFFAIPMLVAGFNPIVVFFAEAFVQLYQTLLHTEVIRKFPRPIEAVMNTPSHHRVHHGSNPQYIDKNYAGVFIIWDKMFGTFEEEDEKVDYGLVNQIESVNPFVVFFHGLTRMFSKMAGTKGFGAKLGYIVQPPDWQPKHLVERGE